MATKPQLLYFNLTGRGEIIRLLYNHAGVEFEDKRITFAEYPPYKTNQNELPLGFLPVLTTPCGKKLSQTTAIIRYVASELNLFGKTSVERALIDAVIISNKELGDIVIDILFATEKKEDRATKLESLGKKATLFFTYFERLIKENGGPFINGSEITVADIYTLDTLQLMSQAGPNNLEKYPLLEAAYKKVAESENLKKYLAARK